MTKKNTPAAVAEKPVKTTAAAAKPPRAAGPVAVKTKTKKLPAAAADKAQPAEKAQKPTAAKLDKVPKKPAKKAAKPRPKLVRDSFTMPETDFALIATLKARALLAQRHAKKSELLRAGLQVLAALDAPALVQALDRLQPIQVGRPKKGA